MSHLRLCGSIICKCMQIYEKASSCMINVQSPQYNRNKPTIKISCKYTFGWASYIYFLNKEKYLSGLHQPKKKVVKGVIQIYPRVLKEGNETGKSSLIRYLCEARVESVYERERKQKKILFIVTPVINSDAATMTLSG